MKKISYIFLIMCLTVTSVTYAAVTNPFRTFEGGTGSTTPSGLLYGDNGATNHLNTATIGSGCTFIGGTLSCSGGGGSSGNVATSSHEVANQIAIFSSNSATPALIGGSSGLTYGSNILSVTGAVSTTYLQLGEISSISTPGAGTGFYYAKDDGFPYYKNSAGTDYNLANLGTVTSITATSPLTGGVITTTGSIGCQTASGSQDGCLSSADWTTFNNKQAAGNYLTSYDAWTHPIAGTSATTSNITINGNGFNGIGTTTPRYLLQISTSTAQQLVLTDGTNVNGIAMRSVGNNFYLATTSPTTFATSSPIITILGQNGAVIINNSLSFNGGVANPITAKLTVNDKQTYNNGYGQIAGCGQGTATQQGSCTSMGYDNTNAFGFVQAYIRGNAFDTLRVNPAGGCVSVGWSIGAGCTSLLSIDYPNQNPTQFSSNQALELGNGGNTGIWSLQTIGIGSHTSSATMPQIIFGGIQVTPSPAPHSAGYDFFIATRRDATAANTAPATSTTWTMSGVMEVGSSTPGYGTYTRSAKVLIATTTDPQLSLENGANIVDFAVQSDGSLVYATSSPTTGATSSPVFMVSANGNFGIATSSPTVALDINGLVRAQQTATTTCSNVIEGSIFYNSTPGNQHFYGCDGANWKQLDN